MCPGECPTECHRKSGCLRECPGECLPSAQQVSPECPRSVKKVSRTSQGYFGDTCWTLGSPGPEKLRDTPPDARSDTLIFGDTPVGGRGCLKSRDDFFTRIFRMPSPKCFLSKLRFNLSQKCRKSRNQRVPQTVGFSNGVFQIPRLGLRQMSTPPSALADPDQRLSTQL